MKFWKWYVLIVGLSIVVYWPSFYHLFRGETYTYFLNTAGDSSFWSLIANTYNYEKVRVFEPGDTLVFRPLLFVVLAFQKSVFGMNYMGWRIMDFAMHMIAVLAMFRLLWKIRRGKLAVLGTLFFATSYMIINTVLYEQIASYTLFTALVLTSLYYIYEGKHLWVAFACMLVSCFFYELGVIFTAVMAFYLWRRGEHKWAIIFPTAIIAYLSFYIPQKLINSPATIGLDTGTLFNWQSIPYGIQAAVTLGGTWFAQTIMPLGFNLVPIVPLKYYSVQAVGAEYLILSIINVALFGVLAWAVMKSKARGDNRFTSLLAGMTLIFILILSVFRIRSHGLAFVVNHNFGSYMFLAWFLVFGYSLLRYKTFTTKQVNVIIAVVLAFIAISASKTALANWEVASKNADERNYLAIVSQWVEQHKDEANFTFAVKPDEKMIFQTFKLENGQPVIYDYTIPKILYPQYWNEANPKYTLQYLSETKEWYVRFR